MKNRELKVKTQVEVSRDNEMQLGDGIFVNPSEALGRIYKDARAKSFRSSIIKKFACG